MPKITAEGGAVLKKSLQPLSPENNGSPLNVPDGYSPLGVTPGDYAISENVSDGILNMRSGPGQGHPIVIAIPAGSGGVTIGSCRTADDGRSRNSWCEAQWKSYSGWVSSGGIVPEFPSLPVSSPSPSRNNSHNEGRALGNPCDDLAAAPWDPDAPDRDKAMDFGKLNVSAAIRVCAVATAEFPNERRYWFQLGRAYDKNAQNTEAAKVYAKAAAMGSTSAMVNLGILYERGQGVTQDHGIAREWFRKAADQGNPTGMYCYATTLDNGIGGSVDQVLAIKWYERAAQNGKADATRVLTQLRENGAPTNTRCN